MKYKIVLLFLNYNYQRILPTNKTMLTQTMETICGQHVQHSQKEHHGGIIEPPE